MRAALLLLLGGCGRVAFDPVLAGDAGGTADGVPDLMLDAPPAGGAIDVWYRMNEGSGNTLVDDGFANLGAIVSGAVQWRAGSLRFTGAGYAAASLDGTFRTYPVTIMGWFAPEARSDQTSNAYGLQPYPANALSNDVPGVGGFGIGPNVWTDGTPGSALRIGWATTTIAQTFTPDAQVHIALTYLTNQNATVFVNGVNVASRGTAPPDTMMSTLYIGAHNDDTMYGTRRFFVGEIDDVRIYRRLLSPQDIADIYAQGPY